ncbi:MAG: hypothetical protein EOP06_00240 [Proteobacteria bacterium]|nr:MAG: hypothetical protein EOP06_00240 [Pseudomonadota bacterium]
MKYAAKMIALSLLSFCLSQYALALPASESSVEATFNMPGFNGGVATTIEDKAVELTRRAAAGSQIFVSMYEFDSRVLAKEFLAANARGVTIRLVLDGKSKKFSSVPGHPVEMLTGSEGRAGLECKSASGSSMPCVTFCKSLIGSSCRGLHINHNKFYLFSALSDGRESVVMQTSMNANKNQYHQHNDALMVYDNTELYEGYLTYWMSLQSDKFRLGKFPTLTAGDNATAYFFPRLIGSDPVLANLKKVGCHLPGSSVRVVQSRFDNSRSKVAKQLAKLRSEGCRIHVIARQESDVKSPGTKIEVLIKPDLTVLAYKGKGAPDQSQNSVHSKLILIDASFDGSPDRKAIVMSGSHNLNLTSLKTNDETLLRITNRKIFEKYSQYFNAIIESARASGKILND